MWLKMRKVIGLVILTIASIAVTMVISLLMTYDASFDKHSKCDLASSDEFPYHVWIQQFMYECSGSLIRNDVVLTVASCVYRGSERHMKVFVEARALPGGTPYDVDKIIIHNNYNYTISANDIAVIKLAEVVDFWTPILLPNKQVIFREGLQLLASGYFNPDGHHKSDQRKFHMRVVNMDKCRKSFRSVKLGRDVDMFGKICTAAAPGYPSCLGDNGSPATLDGKYLVGIHLMAKNCGVRGIPELYIDVSSYLTFIKSSIA